MQQLQNKHKGKPLYIEIMIMMHCTADFCTLHHLKSIYIYYI